VDAATGAFVNGASIVPAGDTNARFIRGDATWLNVVPAVEPISPAGEAMIADIRAMATSSVGTGFDELLVGGGTAALVDTKDAIFSRIWIAGLTIVGATFVLLFLMFNSVLVPLKAIVLNTLSLGATFGMMVWVFQSGHLSETLGFTATGTTDTTTPILMFCIACGLSMDYEVFLLARMKEEYDRTGDNDKAIVEGLAKTGRLVTAAALLLAVTFLSFAVTSSVSTIKLFGLGLAVAVLVDAFVVRVTLVPALMSVAGKWNWWAPAWMHRMHERIGLSEAEPELDLRDILDLRDTPVVDLRTDERTRT
jgi:RND superfamily putative drug exporter